MNAVRGGHTTREVRPTGRVRVESWSVCTSVFHFGRLSTVAIHRPLPSLAASQSVVSPSMPCPWRFPGLSPPHNHSPRCLNRPPIHAHGAHKPAITALCLARTGIGNRSWMPHLNTLPPRKTLGFSLTVQEANLPLETAGQSSIISFRILRTSSIDAFSRRIASFSSSWFWVAFTLMSANLLGNRIDVSSHDRAE